MTIQATLERNLETWVCPPTPVALPAGNDRLHDGAGSVPRRPAMAHAAAFRAGAGIVASIHATSAVARAALQEAEFALMREADLLEKAITGVAPASR
ncbi:hypothetical protein [Cellulomonas chengniuliangii]|uniref:Uncharacterized protein n=1 Tax=Cellulomonas chengniuliangii TaxID=2968084 RepID=A0ABY5KVM5_9CELL|nr:hypothetical protein [Cellulomonas chengniuliangii]MCC2308524.1 hypothetical protein [Cellulomonas chengniuliangii]MCC2317541.1 hypothetical protein [Cellulomonas chengniuliangii]UUI73888.1 hypothetical protein NP064_08495 [Cellulomonas chengniuliangii]